MPTVNDTTFLGLRTLLVQKTGHFHLVGSTTSGGDTVPDYTSDNGANLYILKAIRWCDRYARHCRKVRKENITVAADTPSIAVNAHTITMVRLTDQALPLTQCNEQWLWENLGADLTDIDSAEIPLYWALKTQDYSDVGANRDIWILPPPAEEATAEVYGVYYTPALSADTDTNWWTLNFSELVLYVAMQIVNDLDLNPFTNSTLARLVEEVRRQMIVDDVQEEVAFYGSTMAG